jgi:hypothetical protein
MKGTYTAPEFNLDAFHCPHCEAYSHQTWYGAARVHSSSGNVSAFLEDTTISVCQRCHKFTIWLGKRMIYPDMSIASLPSEDMPPNVKEDYLEARSIVSLSPRASTALLRLALQKLMVHLGESGKDINNDIANLVKKGLPVTIQKALDLVRVIGNNAVHPGELDLKDDSKTAVALFGLVNMIVNVMITQPKEIDELYHKVPKAAQEAIEKRDTRTPVPKERTQEEK